jgi:hypothetical protein
VPVKKRRREEEEATPSPNAARARLAPADGEETE